ncbi:MAG: hypothetical protein ACRC9L_05925 [Brevinema sp.]
MDKKCIICGDPIMEDANDNQICDNCEETRDELSNGRGDKNE